MSTKSKLIKKRDLILAHLSRSKTFLRGFDVATQQHLVSVRLEKLEGKWEDFEQLQLEIEELEDKETVGVDTDAPKEEVEKRAKELEELEREREDMMKRFEDLYYEVRAGLLSKLPQGVASTSSNGSTVSSQTHAGVHLPKIELPKFNGDYDQWLPFHDTFKSLIHDNSNLMPIQKFHYLRSCVEDKAERRIENIKLSDANYGIAWETLVKRFGNKYLQKKRHVNALLQFPRAQKLTVGVINDVIDCFDRHTKILDQLGEVTMDWGVLLTQLLVSKLDEATQKKWEEHVLRKADPTFKDLIDFLEDQTMVLDAIAVDRQPDVHQSVPMAPALPMKKAFPNLAVNATSASPVSTCPLCSGTHLVASCPEFKRLTVDERLGVMWSKRLCRNCLRVGHIARQCRITFCCGTCGERHHTLIHTEELDVGTLAPEGPDNVERQSKIGSTPPVATSSSDSSQQALLGTVDAPQAVNVAANSGKVQVFLSTVLVSVKDRNGRSHMARALLDSGSQANLISERLCSLLRLPRKRVSVPIAGIGNSRMQINGSVSTVITSRITDYSVPMDFLILRKVAEDQPSSTIPVDGWQLPSDMVLADPGFHERAPIDILLGLEYFFEFLLLNGGRVQIQRPAAGLPLFVNTVFGWIAAGKTDLGSLNPITSCHVSIAHNEVEEKPRVAATQEQLLLGYSVKQRDAKMECAGQRLTGVRVQTSMNFYRKQNKYRTGEGGVRASPSVSNGHWPDVPQKSVCIKQNDWVNVTRRKRFPVRKLVAQECQEYKQQATSTVKFEEQARNCTPSKVLKGWQNLQCIGGRRIFPAKQKPFAQPGGQTKSWRALKIPRVLTVPNLGVQSKFLGN